MPNEDLEAFIAKNRKRRSVFDDFKEEILKMDGLVPQTKIIEYIKSKTAKGTRGLTQPNLSEWLKRQKKKTPGKTKVQENVDDTESDESAFEKMMNKMKGDQNE